VGVQLRGLIDGASAKIDAEYAVNNDKDFLKLNGTISALNLSRFMSSAQGSLPLYSDDSVLPFNWLNWLDLEANLKINNLDLNHIRLTNVDSELNVKGKVLKLTRLHANLYESGKIDGTAEIKVNNAAYDIVIDNQISNVDLKKMFINLFDVSAINGLADFTFNTQVHKAKTYQDLRKNLDGKIGLTVRNGGFSGVDFSLFLSPENLAAFQSKSQLMTKFSTLNAKFEFESGISQNSSINFSSPSILATGRGLIDFAATKINYHLNVSSIMPLNEQHIKSVSIPVGIDGDLFNPQISIQNMTLNTVEPKVVKPHKRK
jgi:AsmA protein